MLTLADVEVEAYIGDSARHHGNMVLVYDVLWTAQSAIVHESYSERGLKRVQKQLNCNAEEKGTQQVTCCGPSSNQIVCSQTTRRNVSVV